MGQHTVYLNLVSNTKIKIYTKLNHIKEFLRIYNQSKRDRETVREREIEFGERSKQCESRVALRVNTKLVNGKIDYVESVGA